MDRVAISAVIPLYNEAENIQELYEGLSNQLRKAGAAWEIVFVDDGSTDGSPEMLRNIVEVDENVTVVQLARNFGQNAAVWAGIDRARGEVILTMDGDLQYSPDELQGLIEKVSDAHPLIIGRRRQRKSPPFRALGSVLYCRLMRLFLKGAFPEDASSLRAFRRDVAVRLQDAGARSCSFSLLTAKAGIPFEHLAVEHQKRKKGRSKYSVWKLAWIGAENIMAATRFFLYGAVALLVVSIVAVPFCFLALVGIVIAMAIIVAHRWHFGRTQSVEPLYEVRQVLRKT
jgi:glycosyltransferase involved in cell wall biosynthesis